MNAEDAGDGAVWDLFVQKFFDLLFLAGEFGFWWFAAFWTAEDDAFGAFAGEGFFGELRDETAFDLGGKDTKHLIQFLRS